MVDSNAAPKTSGKASADGPPEQSPSHKGNGARPDATPPEPMSRLDSNAQLFERIDSLHRERSSRWWSFLRRLCGSR